MRQPIYVIFLRVIAVSSICLASGCGKPATREAAPSSQSARYDLKGKVVSIDKSAKQLTVDHGDIPGFMGAMTMPYPVKDERALTSLSPGDQITAKVVSANGSYWLEEIAVVKADSSSVKDK
jgi:protein SCO1